MMHHDDAFNDCPEVLHTLRFARTEGRTGPDGPIRRPSMKTKTRPKTCTATTRAGLRCTAFANSSGKCPAHAKSPGCQLGGNWRKA